MWFLSLTLTFYFFECLAFCKRIVAEMKTERNTMIMIFFPSFALQLTPIETDTSPSHFKALFRVHHLTSPQKHTTNRQDSVDN